MVSQPSAQVYMAQNGLEAKGAISKSIRNDVQSLGFTNFDVEFDGRILFLYNVTPAYLHMTFFHVRGMVELLGVADTSSEAFIDLTSEDYSWKLVKLPESDWKLRWLDEATEFRPQVFLSSSHHVTSPCYMSGRQMLEKFGISGGCNKYYEMISHHVVRKSRRSRKSRRNRRSRKPSWIELLKGLSSGGPPSSHPQRSGKVSERKRKGGEGDTDEETDEGSDGGDADREENWFPVAESDDERQEGTPVSKTLTVEIFGSPQPSVEGWEENVNAGAKRCMNSAISQLSLQNSRSYICPVLKMTFLYTKEKGVVTKVIEVECWADFQMGGASVNRNHFGWFQDDLSISFGCEDPRAAVLFKETFLNKLEDREIRENWEKKEEKRETTVGYWWDFLMGLRYSLQLGSSSSPKHFIEGRGLGSYWRGSKPEGSIVSSGIGTKTFRQCLTQAKQFVHVRRTIRNLLRHKAVLLNSETNLSDRWQENGRKDLHSMDMFSSIKLGMEGGYYVLGTGVQRYIFNASNTLSLYEWDPLTPAQEVFKHLSQKTEKAFYVNLSFSHMESSHMETITPAQSSRSSGSAHSDSESFHKGNGVSYAPEGGDERN